MPTPFCENFSRCWSREYGAKKVVYATKYSYSAPCAVETLDSLINECDVVVHGVAD